jgi:hypothetical protein
MKGRHLSEKAARLVPRSQRHTLDPAFLGGIEVWCTLAHRDSDAVDVYKTDDPVLRPGVIVVDDTDDAELHLVLEQTPPNGEQLAVAVFVEELAW